MCWRKRKSAGNHLPLLTQCFRSCRLPNTSGAALASFWQMPPVLERDVGKIIRDLTIGLEEYCLQSPKCVVLLQARTPEHQVMEGTEHAAKNHGRVSLNKSFPCCPSLGHHPPDHRYEKAPVPGCKLCGSLGRLSTPRHKETRAPL